MSILHRFRLAGTVAIVTGAPAGIGVAIATALAEAGADVAPLSSRPRAVHSGVVVRRTRPQRRPGDGRIPFRGARPRREHSCTDGYLTATTIESGPTSGST